MKKLGMKKLMVATAAMAALFATPALAGSHFSFGFSSAPTYVAPAPVYYAPPAPVYYAPRAYYAPAYYAPAPAYYAPRYYRAAYSPYGYNWRFGYSDGHHWR